jgi:spermidine synthase
MAANTGCAVDAPAGVPRVMIELPNPFAGEGGVLRVLEAADCDRKSLIARILDESYDRPYVIEQQGVRSLYFTRALTQSEMRISAPYALQFAYSQRMMSFLMFAHQPRHILMLGLGGGSLLKFCRHHLPDAHLTSVEINADVLAFRDQFMVPPNDAHLRVLHGDGAAWLRDCTQPQDVVVMDAFDRDGFAVTVSTREFYLDVRDALSAQGMLVANMVGAKATRGAHLDLIADVFDGNLIVLPIVRDGNYLVFAFRDPLFEPRWRWIENQAKAMQARFGLDFPGFAAELKRSRKDGYRQAALLQAEA